MHYEDVAKSKDIELLKLVMREEKDDTIENLLKEYHSIPNLIAGAELEDLIHIQGMDQEKANLLKAIYELAVLVYRYKKDENKSINSSAKAGNYLVPILSRRETEAFVILFMDNQNTIIDHKIISSGTINEAPVYPREVLKAAIRRNAGSIMIAHNHPGGSLKPSQGDIAVTKKLIDAAQMLDIKILDHLIVAHDKFFSFAEEGLLF